VFDGYTCAEDQATVQAWGRARVHAADRATVRASQQTYVVAWGHSTIFASGNAAVHVCSPNAKVFLTGNATAIIAHDTSYKHSANSCWISGCVLRALKPSGFPDSFGRGHIITHSGYSDADLGRETWMVLKNKKTGVRRFVSRPIEDPSQTKESTK